MFCFESFVFYILFIWKSQQQMRLNFKERAKEIFLSLYWPVGSCKDLNTCTYLCPQWGDQPFLRNLATISIKEGGSVLYMVDKRCSTRMHFHNNPLTLYPNWSCIKQWAIVHRNNWFFSVLLVRPSTDADFPLLQVRRRRRVAAERARATGVSEGVLPLWWGSSAGTGVSTLRSASRRQASASGESQGTASVVVVVASRQTPPEKKFSCCWVFLQSARWWSLGVSILFDRVFVVEVCSRSWHGHPVGIRSARGDMGSGVTIAAVVVAAYTMTACLGAWQENVRPKMYVQLGE